MKISPFFIKMKDNKDELKTIDEAINAEAVFTVRKWLRWNGWDQEIQGFLLDIFYIHEQSSRVEKVWYRVG
jgi:hypothetical protein